MELGAAAPERRDLQGRRRTLIQRAPRSDVVSDPRGKGSDRPDRWALDVDRGRGEGLPSSLEPTEAPAVPGSVEIRPGRDP